MNHDRDDPPHKDHDSDEPERGRKIDRDEQSDISRRQAQLRTGASHLPGCALLAGASGWADRLEQLGARRFKRPEALYRSIRSRAFTPEACIVDLDYVPRKLIKAVDIRVPCPKLWVGGSAANPADIKNFGIYYARVRPDELNAVIGRLVEIDQSILLPAGLAGGQLLPFVAADKAYRERLQHYTNVFARTGLLTLQGDDPLELQLAAQSLAVETQRARIWEVKTEASIESVLRKITQARRPGSDVTIVLSQDIDVESAREFQKSMPREYSMIKLSARTDSPVDADSFTLPVPDDRPADIEARIVWFVCRSTIDHGIALSDLDGLVESIVRTLGGNPSIDDIRALCERSVRQHATLMEDRAEFISYDDMVRNYERTILRRALTQHDWNLSAAARSLGLAESSLRYKLKKLGVSKHDASEHNGE